MAKQLNTNNASATVTPAAPVKPTAEQAQAALAAYTKQCQAVQKTGPVHARTAYLAQQAILAGKPVTQAQLTAYTQFVTLVQQAQVACTTVKGKATACGIFNYLDGRVTGHKVATGLGNSISLRAFLDALPAMPKQLPKPAAAAATPATASA